MRLECVFYGPFRDAVGAKTVTHETDAETVGDLLAELEAAYPSLEGELLDEPTDGERRSERTDRSGRDDRAGLAGDTVVAVGGRHVTQLDGLETPLEPGVEVRMIPSVYGG